MNPTAIEALIICHSLNELFYAEESINGTITIKSNDPLVKQLALFCAKHGNQALNPRAA